MTQQSPSAGTLRRGRRPRPAPPRRSLAARRPAGFVRPQAALFAAVPLINAVGAKNVPLR